MCSTTKMKYDSNSNSNNNNGVHHEDSSPDVSENKKKKKQASRLGLFMRFLLRFILFELPVLLCFLLLLSTIFIQELWYGPLNSLIDSFKLKPNDNMDDLLGLYEARDNEITYYNRKCDIRDISTKDANDLLIEDNMTFNERRSTMLTHGAVVMKNILSKNTSTELRNYLEGRHQEFHSTNSDNTLNKLSWNELFWDGDDGSRLALGLGPEDSSIVKKAISEVGLNHELKKTLESIVGHDPSIVEVSTLSTMHNAEPQGIHTDSDYFGSSVLYTRSFLHSYTMFIALQDTTAKMGATTLCPGTHWCADIDLENLCQCDTTNDSNGNDNDINDENGVCNTFEASSNGQTGINNGVLLQGDAMMFNQNIWHRGPRNYDLQHQKNRVMFIVTFVSRRSTIEEGDNRQQGWGTYYYMRHNMWGNTLSDLGTVLTGWSMNLWTSRIWKAYGLFAGRHRKGNLPWLEHFARQLANDMDFFESGELYDFKNHLQELKSNNSFMNFLFSASLVDDTKKAANDNNTNGSNDDDGDEDDNVDNEMEEDDNDDDEDDDNDDNWNDYLSLLVESAVYQSQILYFYTLLATIIIYLTTTLVQMSSSTSGDQPLKQQQQHNQQSTTPSSSTSTSTTSLSRRNRWWFPLLRLVFGHVVIFGMGLFIRQYVLYEAPLLKRIHTNEINFQPFQELPSHILGVETHFDEITGEIESTTTHKEQLYPVDILYQKQIHEQNEYKKLFPKHTNHYYYEKEIERIQHVRHVPVVVVVNEIPKQATAYPERYDILIGTRYDANFLSSMNDMLDYHPGNIIWNNLINEFSEYDYGSSVLGGEDDDATSMINIIAQNIVHNILGRQQEQSLVLGSISSSGINSNYHEGVPRRFLKQDYETGYWIIMTKKEATEITRYELLSSFDSTNRIDFLWTYWKQVLAKSRFGARRNTIMSKKNIPLIVDSWLFNTKNGLLFQKNRNKESCDDSSKTKKPSLLVTPMTTMTIMGASASTASAATAIRPSLSSSVMPSYYLLPSTARNILPKSLVSGGSSSSSANNSFLSEKNIAGDKNTFVSLNDIPFRQHLKEINSNTITLKIGDIITVKGTDANANDNDNDEDDNEESSSSQNQLPYQAMIIDIDDEENLDIQPIRTDNIDNDDDSGTIRSVHINEIQLYRPVNENDKVWVFTTDDNTWKIYEVLFITPWGTADVLLTDEYFLDLYNKNKDTNDDDDDDDDDDEDDDGEEEIENEAIVMDIRDFFLIDDEVPFIRLKQY